MSAKKRRIKRKIERMVKLVQQAQRYYQGRHMHKRSHMWWAIIVPIGKALDRKYVDRAKAAVDAVWTGRRNNRDDLITPPRTA